MDGLLGIGSAGGGKDKNEGKMLAQRLDVMRMERDARSKPKKSARKVAAAAPEPVMAGLPEFEFQDPFDDDDSGVVELTGADGGVMELTGEPSGGGGMDGGRGRRGNPRRSKNKNKKRKNKK